MELVRTHERPRSTWRDASSVASIGAGAIHLAAARAHFTESVIAGTFMASIGALQLGWGIAVACRGSRTMRIAATTLNSVVVGVWVVSRTVGTPVGEMPWMPEPAGAQDGLATVLQLVIIGAALFPHRLIGALGDASLAVSLAGAVFAAIVSGADPSWEQPVGTATLALAVLARAWAHHLGIAKEDA